MKAMVLAAGRGTRLRPLTVACPKPLVPWFDRPLLAWALDRVARCGADPVVVNAAVQADAVGAAVARWATGRRRPRVFVSVEPRPLGTAGGLARARHWLEGDDLLVVNADIVTTIDLDAARRAHAASAADVTLVVVEAAAHGVAPNVVVDDGGRVRWLAGVGPADGRRARFAYTGMLVASPGLWRWIPQAPPPTRGWCLKEDVLWPMLRAGAPVRAWIGDGLWSDVGTPRTYLQTHLRVLGDPALLAHWTPAEAVEDPVGVWRCGDVALAPRCRLAPPVWLGTQVRCDAGARVGPHVVVGRGARLSGGAVVRDCVVWATATVAAPVQRAVVWVERPGGPARTEPVPTDSVAGGHRDPSAK